MIALLSDSHDNKDSVNAALALIKAREVTHVVHCGDIVSPHMLPMFAGLPMQFVFGNNETKRDELNSVASSLGFPPIDDEAIFEIAGKRCYLYHGTRELFLLQQITKGGHDFVFHGHSHRMRNETIGSTQVINPGALHRASTYSIAFLEVATGDVEFCAVIPD